MTETGLRRVFLLPSWVLVAMTMLVPLAIIGAYSVLDRGVYGGVELPFTGGNYSRIWDPLYGAILVRSFAVALLATVLCVALGFPLALFIARSGTRRNLYLSLVVLPFWTSFLIRLYAWMFLLRDSGLINSVLLGLGWIHRPLPLLYNDGAVILGLVYGFLPFAVLPLYATLEKLDPALLEAAADLGATPFAVMRRIVIPLCRPGIMAAAILVFVPCLGTYIVSDLLGGSRTILIGNLIQNQFSGARDWPFGSALSMVLLLLTVLLLWSVRRKGEEVL